MNDIDSFLGGLDHLRAMVDPWHRTPPSPAQRADVIAQMGCCERIVRMPKRERSATAISFRE